IRDFHVTGVQTCALPISLRRPTDTGSPLGPRVAPLQCGPAHCRLLSEGFPDHRLMLASLGEATTRATVSKDPLLRALEEHPGERSEERRVGEGCTARRGR